MAERGDEGEGKISTKASNNGGGSPVALEAVGPASFCARATTKHTVTTAAPGSTHGRGVARDDSDDRRGRVALVLADARADQGAHWLDRLRWLGEGRGERAARRLLGLRDDVLFERLEVRDGRLPA